MSYRAIARELQLHPAIASLRIGVGAYKSYCEMNGQWISSLVDSDLAHDERAILGHPNTAFAWVVNPLGTYMVRAERNNLGHMVGHGHGNSRSTRSVCVNYLRCVADAGGPLRFRFWDGDTMRGFDTVDELIEAYTAYEGE